MVGQTAGLGEKILERGTLDVLHFARTAIAGVEVILKERAEIDFFKWIFFLGIGSCSRAFFYGSAVALFLAAIYIIEQGN